MAHFGDPRIGKQKNLGEEETSRNTKAPCSPAEVRGVQAESILAFPDLLR